MNRAIALNPKYGDAWVYYYCLEYVQHFKRVLVERKDLIKQVERIDHTGGSIGLSRDFMAIVDVGVLADAEEEGKGEG